MADPRYGVGFTSVKVKYAPGGSSSINLGWDEPRATVVNRNEGRNSEKRNAVQDPFKSRDGMRNVPDREEEVYQNYQRGNPEPNYPHREVPSSSAFKPALPRPIEPLSFKANYFQPKDDPYSKPQEYNPPMNHFSPPQAAQNYFKPPEAYNENYPNYPVPQARDNYMQPPQNRPDNVYRGEPYQQNPGRQFNQPGLPPKYGVSQQGNYSPADAFDRQHYGGQDDRRAPSYAVKNSVKVSNPPGGQSSIFFG